MSVATLSRAAVGEDAVREALGTVVDPELDEPITDLGFVRSITLQENDLGVCVEVHLRLPTSFCAPNFAYLMASDAKDAVEGMRGVASVVVELDDHHDSGLINAGLAADAGYRGTFRHEAEQDLDELRETFKRKAHTAAMERCLTALLNSGPTWSESNLGEVRLRDLPDSPHTDALMSRRAALGLSTTPESPVLVDAAGRLFPAGDVPMALRRARATRISIDGNAHFCRGLLRTRYGDDVVDVADHPLIPLTVKETQA